MKTFITIALLSALAACCSASVFPSKEELARGVTVVENADEAELQKFLSTHPNRQALNESVVLFETTFFVPAIPGEVVTHRIEYIGGPNTKMTGSQRTHLPPLPADVHSSGWLTNHLVKTFTSQVGGNIIGNVKFYGHKYGY